LPPIDYAVPVPRLRIAAMVCALLIAACSGGTTSPPPIESATPMPSLTVPPPGPTATPTIQPAPSPTAPTEPPLTASPAPRPGLGEGSVAWSKLELDGGPSAREDHTFTPDADGRYAYLFAGRAGNDAFNDLWRYDLANDAWQLIEPRGLAPAPRFGHVAVWQPELGLVVWSGQQSARVFFGDIWSFDPGTEQWQELPDAGDVPEARYGSCGSIGPDGRLWISHGFTEDTGRFFDTRAYDFGRLAWTDETPAEGDVPVLRCLHDCLWTPDGELVLYGGQTTGAPAIGDLWSYGFVSGAWAEAERPAAPPRQLYALASIGPTAFVFGGAGADGALLDDLWRLDLTGLTMSPADVSGAEGPGARLGATLLADEARGRMILFGGKGEAGELADLWILSPSGA
jgi:hypothetical protein